MAKKYPKLEAKKREILGRKVKKLRKTGILPANLYGKKIKSESLQVTQKDFVKIYKDVGETGVVELTIANQKPHPVLIQNVQKEPVADNFLHVDFRQVDLREKITTPVPLELIGEAPAVAKGGVLVQLLNEVEVKALPTDLPEKLIVDISSLAQVGQFLSVADLTYDKKKIQLKDNLGNLVVKIEPPAKEEEVKPVAPAEEAKEEEAKGKEEEKVEEKKVVEKSEEKKGTTGEKAEEKK